MPAASSRSPAARAPRLRARLPWWAPALAVLSFAVLLTLVASPAEARAVSVPQGLGPLLELLAALVRGGA
ncbi:hypothetical protein [Streptomyces angustmyceticus]|uniref:hypothetical protein n=1 Tax=Streptomyces angustmyceticus TaxID=285578 RepID=UPI0037FFCDE6